MQYLIKYLDKINSYRDANQGIPDLHPEVAKDFEVAIKNLQVLAEIEVLYNMTIRDSNLDVHAGFVSAQRFINFAKNHVEYRFK